MMKNKSNTKRILKILLIFFAIGMLCTGGMLIYYWTRYSADRNANEAVKRLAYQASDDGTNNSLNSGESGSTGDNKTSFSTKSINFGALSEMNPEIIGWISACGELIDGPVVQTDNNDYYLSHLFDNSAGKAGCFFADTYSNPAFECPFTVVYGHYRKDKSMFYFLHYYKDQAYYLAHPTFTIYTEEGEKEYQIFSVFYGDYEADFEKLYEYGIKSIDGSADKVKNIFNMATSKSLYDILSTKEGAKIADALDQDLAKGATTPDIVVLYTCEYSGANNRMFVFGINLDE